jgi:histone H3/H4
MDLRELIKEALEEHIDKSLILKESVEVITVLKRKTEQPQDIGLVMLVDTQNN